MKYLFCLILFFSAPCQAEEKTLHLDSALREESASEEGVLLVQCLTGDGKYTWAMGAGMPYLHLAPAGPGNIELTLTTEKESIRRVVREGELLLQCESLRKRLESTQGKAVDLAPTPHELPVIPNPVIEEKPHYAPWILAGAAVAIGVGAYFLFRSKKASYEQIQTGP